MQYLLSSAALQGLVLLILCVLPTYAYSVFNGNSKELLSIFRLRCGFLECPYGYETDVEGNPVCKCYDPCKYVYCLGGTKCVIEVQKKCNWQDCKPKAGCQDIGGKRRRKKINLYTRPLSDDAGVGSKTPAASPMCYLPLTEEAKDCTGLRKKKRWFFDPESGKCMKFRGCKTGGNNFGRKKRCKRKCMRKRKSPRRKGRRTRLGKKSAKQ